MSGVVHDPVPLGPFSEWCRQIRDRYGTEKAAAAACGVAPRQFGRWVRGEGYNQENVVCLGRVDEVLVSEGSTLLNELYPLDVEAA